MKNFEILFTSWTTKRNGVYGMVNGELTHMKVVGAVAYISTEKSFVLCETPNAERIEMAFADLYDSVDEYKNGKPIDNGKCKLHYKLHGNTEWVEGEVEKQFHKFMWRIDDVSGEPTMVYIIPEDRLVFDNCFRLVEGENIPADYYMSREECIKWSDLTIVEQDGTRREQKSVLKPLLLTDEQRAIVAEIADAVKRAKDAGILIGYSGGYDDRWFGLNIADHDAEYNYTDNIDEDEFSAVLTRSESWSRFELDIPALNFVNDDNSCICIK